MSRTRLTRAAVQVAAQSALFFSPRRTLRAAAWDLHPAHQERPARQARQGSRLRCRLRCRPVANLWPPGNSLTPVLKGSTKIGKVL